MTTTMVDELVGVLVEEMRDGGPVCRRGDGFGDHLEAGDGRVRGRAVPYGVEVELRPGLREVFERGAFAAAVRAPDRTKICLEHGQVVGRMTRLEERDDGLWFEGRVSGNPAIPEALRARALIDEGLVDEMSVGFQTVRGGTRTEQLPDGTTRWTHSRARLLEVSLVPWGAYGREATLSRSVLIDPREGLLAARRAEIREQVAALRARAGH